MFGNGHEVMLVVVWCRVVRALTIGGSRIVLIFIVVLYSSTPGAASEGTSVRLRRLRQTLFRVRCHIYIVVTVVGWRSAGVRGIRRRHV